VEGKNLELGSQRAEDSKTRLQRTHVSKEGNGTGTKNENGPHRRLRIGNLMTGTWGGRNSAKVRGHATMPLRHETQYAGKK